MTETPTPTDGSRFNQALTTLIERAYKAGVDIEGGWKCVIDGNGDDYWDVQITTVEYDSNRPDAQPAGDGADS